jgi:TRAP transporter 4TM/12TM fusion protein
MKKAGYTPEQASAIEAAASNGGQFLPPVMGATVFVMAAYTGIPYLEIAKASLVPALLYFVILLVYAELNARKLDIKVFSSELNIKELLVDAPLFVVPLASLLGLLLKGYSLMFVVFWSIVIVVVLGILTGIISGKGIDWNEVREKIIEGTVMGCHVALILAVIGIVVAGIEVTGLSLKLSVVLGSLAGDNLFLLLILTMLTSLILGAGIPTPAAYVIVATVLSPALVRQGVPLMQAHLFPMFYAFLSHLTPPIGIGLIIACKLAESDYIRSSIEVFRAGFVSLFLPFCFIYTPAILLQYNDFGSGMLQAIGVIFLFLAISVLLNRQWKYRMSITESGIILIGVICFICSLATKASLFFLMMGLIACVVPLVLNSRRTEIA